jgi:2'-5' RNA ligase
MRVFLALEIPEDLKDEIERSLNELQKICPSRVKWVKREHWHITLQFIGDVEASAIPKLKSGFAEILKGLEQFTISNPETEVIPPRRPRLIWLKCDYDSPQLGNVLKKLRDFLNREGYQIDTKPFRLHITLGRVKQYIAPEIVARLTESAINPGQRTISVATFYESRLHSEGPEYSIIEQYSLQH